MKVLSVITRREATRKGKIVQERNWEGGDIRARSMGRKMAHV
jgi:hypothetical protein